LQPTQNKPPHNDSPMALLTESSTSLALIRSNQAVGFAEPAWLSVAQLCRRWQLERRTIYKFIGAKLLPAWKVGPRLYRVAVADILRFENREGWRRTLETAELSPVPRGIAPDPSKSGAPSERRRASRPRSNPSPRHSR
jgi:excisionase family DNA binding protein